MDSKIDKVVAVIQLHLLVKPESSLTKVPVPISILGSKNVGISLEILV